MARRDKKVNADQPVPSESPLSNGTPSPKKRSKKKGCLGIVGVVIVGFAIVAALAPSGEGPAPADTGAVDASPSTIAQAVDATSTPAPTQAATATPEPTNTPEPTATPKPTETATVAAASRCLPGIYPDLIPILQTDPELGQGVYIRNFVLVKSEEPGVYLGIGQDVGVWFLAGDLEGPGLEGNDDIVVWATNLQGNVFSAEYVTGAFSVFPVLADTNSPVSTDTDGFDEAVECAKEASK